VVRKSAYPTVFLLEAKSLFDKRALAASMAWLAGFQPFAPFVAVAAEGGQPN
jgi:hypothetical protein